jgi:hypothetical protein
MLDGEDSEGGLTLGPASVKDGPMLLLGGLCVTKSQFDTDMSTLDGSGEVIDE